MRMTKREELPRRALRYRKSVVELLNWNDISNSLDELSDQTSKIEYAWDDENVLEAIDGDEELLWELKLAYTGLSDECESLICHLFERSDMADNFNALFMAVSDKLPDKYQIFFDTEDYSLIDRYEADITRRNCSEKLKRLTKDNLLDLVGDSLSILLRYLDIRDRISAIASAVEIVQDENGTILQAVKDIEQQYILADRVGFNREDKATLKYDELLTHIPDKLWVE